jgi:hypothetical protein
MKRWVNTVISITAAGTKFVVNGKTKADPYGSYNLSDLRVAPVVIGRSIYRLSFCLSHPDHLAVEQEALEGFRESLWIASDHYGEAISIDGYGSDSLKMEWDFIGHSFCDEAMRRIKKLFDALGVEDMVGPVHVSQETYVLVGSCWIKFGDYLARAYGLTGLKI